MLRPRTIGVLCVLVIVLPGCRRAATDNPKANVQSEQKGSTANPKANGQSEQKGSTSTASADLQRLIIGKWGMADGSDLIVEFAGDGTMKLTDKANKRKISLDGGKDLTYKLVSEREIAAEGFQFSAEIADDKLTIRGKGPVTILLSAGEGKSVMFPPTGEGTLEFLRQK